MSRRDLLEDLAKRGKYALLYAAMKEREGSEWRVSFGQLESLLEFSLPLSARLHRPWWANQGERGGHSHALAWEMAGWKSSQVDMAGETLVFVRVQNAGVA